MTRIPLEILTHIFRLYLPSWDDQTPGSPPSARHPSRLARVCKLWRATVESDPHLWTSIHFHHTLTERGEEENKMQAVFDLHLKRSGTLPLSLTFTCYHFSESNSRLISLFVNRLRGHSRRWERISLHLPWNSFPLLFEFTHCDLSSLEHLHISSDNGQSVVHAPLLNLDSATNLKSFGYSGSNSSLINTVGLHWERLTEISFDFIMLWSQSPPCQQFTHLGDCQNVITCSLGINNNYSLHSQQTITLPRLQTLRIRRLSNHADTSLFDFLILPQLETLEIDSRLAVLDKFYTPWQDRIISNLLVRSGCALRHLLIQDVDFSNEELVRCLKLSPTLSSLCFAPYPRSQNTVDVIRKLVVSPATTMVGNQTQIQEHKQMNDETGWLLPELQKITLGISREGSLNPIMAMLRSRGDVRTRVAGVAALRHVEVLFFRKPGHQNPSRPRARLKKAECFRSQLAQWASKVDIENADDEVGGGVVTKFGILSTTIPPFLRSTRTIW